MTMINIKEASEMFGVHADTLRGWEEKGYLSPQKTPGGHRRYNREEIENLVQGKPKLTSTERIILHNQCLILSSLDFENSNSWLKYSEALKYGYETDYPTSLIMNNENLSSSEYREIYEILEMFSTLIDFDKNNNQIRFEGFFEENQINYAKYVCKYYFNNLINEPMKAIENNILKYRELLKLWKGMVLCNKKEHRNEAIQFFKKRASIPFFKEKNYEILSAFDQEPRKVIFETFNNKPYSKLIGNLNSVEWYGLPPGTCKITNVDDVYSINKVKITVEYRPLNYQENREDSIHKCWEVFVKDSIGNSIDSLFLSPEEKRIFLKSAKLEPILLKASHEEFVDFNDYDFGTIIKS